MERRHGLFSAAQMSRNLPRKALAFGMPCIDATPLPQVVPRQHWISALDRLPPLERYQLKRKCTACVTGTSCAIDDRFQPPDIKVHIFRNAFSPCLYTHRSCVYQVFPTISLFNSLCMIWLLQQQLTVRQWHLIQHTWRSADCRFRRSLRNSPYPTI